MGFERKDFHEKQTQACRRHCGRARSARSCKNLAPLESCSLATRRVSDFFFSLPRTASPPRATTSTPASPPSPSPSNTPVSASQTTDRQGLLSMVRQTLSGGVSSWAALVLMLGRIGLPQPPAIPPPLLRRLLPPLKSDLASPSRRRSSVAAVSANSSRRFRWSRPGGG